MRLLRAFYDRYAPVLVVFCLLVATGGVIIGTSATFTSGAVVDCLREHADATSKSNKAVRAATVARDDASSAFGRALNREGEAFLTFVNELSRGRVDGPEDLGRLRASLADRARAALALEGAQVNLDQVRLDNPIPAPPAEYCGLGDD